MYLTFDLLFLILISNQIFIVKLIPDLLKKPYITKILTIKNEFIYIKKYICVILKFK